MPFAAGIAPSGAEVATTAEVAQSAAWICSRKTPEDALAFGSLLLDLEAALDASPIRTEFGLAGRKLGIRNYLAEHCPEIGYKTAMRYKSMAAKYRESLHVPSHRPAGVAVQGE